MALTAVPIKPVEAHSLDDPRRPPTATDEPQWEAIEQQCAELRADGVPDATVTRWLFALLHFRAPQQPDAAENLVRRLARLEADEDGPYFGLRKEARGVRLFTALWERQRSIVTELRKHARSCANCESSWLETRPDTRPRPVPSEPSSSVQQTSSNKRDPASCER